MFLKKLKNFEKHFLVIDSIADAKNLFGFTKEEIVIEDDLDIVRFPEDVNNRRKLDAVVLSVISANAKPGKMLDIGTHFGRSATRMAVNSPKSTIYTVNIHPDEAQQAGILTTEMLTTEQIGSFYREKRIQNISQIFANTKTWKVPEEINNLSVVYIDGCHDKEFVFSDTRLIFDLVVKDGFILWHDFSPIYRKNFHWINEAMQGVEILLERKIITGFIYNIRNSWIGIWQKK